MQTFQQFWGIFASGSMRCGFCVSVAYDSDLVLVAVARGVGAAALEADESAESVEELEDFAGTGLRTKRDRTRTHN